jgi:hypothetical protein
MFYIFGYVKFDTSQGWFDVDCMLGPACVCLDFYWYRLRKEKVSSET